MPVAASTIAGGIVHEWPDGFAADLPSEPWLVVHSYPRQEKRLAFDLARKRIPGLLFFERRVRRYPGKGAQTSLVPLLGGYLFVSAGRDRRDEIFATERVVRVLEPRSQDRLPRDLASLRALVLNATEPLMVRPELVAGRRVQVRDGAFAGCEGVIARRQNRLELVVNIALLGTSVSVTLPAELAELAGV
jgi:transcription antitermination factor NusG